MLFCFVCALLFSVACHQKKELETVPEQCQELENLLASGIKAGDQNEFERAESLLRQAAQSAQTTGCRPELWAQCRVEMARIIRRSDRENGAFRAIDTMLLDLKQAQNNWPETTSRFYFHIAYAYRTQEDFWNASTKPRSHMRMKAGK